MKKKLTTILRCHLTLNLARIKCLSHMIFAMLESRQIQLSAMARLFPADVQTESAFKRIQRFLKQVTMPADQVARLLLAILKIDSDEKLTLVFDRTNWKFGKKHINLLFLCVVYRGISIPLFHKKLRVVSQKSWIKNWLIYVIALLAYSGK